MRGTALKAVTPRFASVQVGAGTPKGFKLSSRGQRHGFGARRPRAASP
jgi:hypothetical protein